MAQISFEEALKILTDKVQTCITQPVGCPVQKYLTS